MEFQQGYAYHIKDDYFTKANDDNLMQNKENGNYRPTFFCMEDPRNAGILWMVPLSTRVEKFKAIKNRQENRYGNCLTIVIGEFDSKEVAFLLQNMFPITKYYLDHIHTRNGNPVPVRHSFASEVTTKLQKLRQMTYRGRKVVFTNIVRLEEMMIAELKELEEE